MAITNKKFNKRKKFNKTKNVKKTRKEIRKENRKLKKLKRNEYYSKKEKLSDHDEKQVIMKNTEKMKKKTSIEISSIDILTKQRTKEEKEKQQLKKEMQKQRTKQLLEANESEDKNIKKLEKQLKLNKKKTDSITKSFSGDGLDYILEMCDSETRKTVANAHKSLGEYDIAAELEDDFIIDDEKEIYSNNLNGSESDNNSFEVDSVDNVDYDDEAQLSEDQMSQNDNNLSDESDYEHNLISNKNKKLKRNVIESNERDSMEQNRKQSIKKVKKTKKSKTNNNFDSNESDSDNSSKLDRNNAIKKRKNIPKDDSSDPSSDTDTKDDTTNEWEDIYGRKRDQDGQIISQKSVYVPPALRNELSDKEKAAIERLKREMKGLMNRLTVSNMISVSQQMESLYNRGDHSRHNLNNIFCDLINDAIIQSVSTPSSIMIDYAILIAILHANIDTEIGAIYLEKIIGKYDEILKGQDNDDNKKLRNIVHIISVLYNLKVIHCTMIHDILRNLITNGLTERNSDCILLMLQTVGPVLRKDNLILMKTTLECIHDVINSISEDVKSKQPSRLQYLVNTLTSIKNNNFMKIPNYSPDDVPQMRQVLRNALRPGNQVVQLNISLDDLLNGKIIALGGSIKIRSISDFISADSLVIGLNLGDTGYAKIKVTKRGKWWIVGSAWTGGTNTNNENANKKNTLSTDEEITNHDSFLQLAIKCRMNTETRKLIFITIMSAHNCDDAYEKLLRLSLPHGQDHEIINVLLLSCLHERKFNKYYSVLALKLCDYDRKYKIMLRNAIWDKFKEMNTWIESKVRVLALFLVQMILNNGLKVSVLKVINLGDLNTHLLRFLRITLSGIIIVEDTDIVTRVWAQAGDDHKFKEGLRIFIEQFLLRPNILDGLKPSNRSLLESRGRIALKILQRDRRNGFSL